jgi:formylglycine-generating enzyme required for sulfatase activity
MLGMDAHRECFRTGLMKMAKKSFRTQVQVFLILTGAWALVLCSLTLASTKGDRVGQVGMVRIAAGEFTMGTDDVRSFPNERPAHKVRVEGFWIDEHDVTNAEFEQYHIPGPGRQNLLLSIIGQDFVP